jgi:hypothetical protein
MIGQWFNFFFGHMRNQRSSTVRYAFPMVALLAAMLGLGAVSTSQESSIRLEPSVGTVRDGQPFSVSVYVSAHVAVNAVDIEVTIPPNIEVTGIDRGESVITLWTVDPKVEGNKVILRGGTFRKGFIGEHLIATINAEARDSGLAEFKVTNALLLAGDGAGTTVSFDENTEGAKLYIANADGSFAEGMSVDTEGAVATIVITDIDGDGQVSLGDVSRFMVAWGSRTVLYDFNNDNRMNFKDFSIILSDVFFQ